MILHVYCPTLRFLGCMTVSLLVLAASLTGCKDSDRPQTTVATDTLPQLVLQIRKCSRLYTAEYRVHKIVTFDDVVRLRGKMFAKSYSVDLPIGDRKVAIPMDATLKAYIDFSDFSEQDVSRQADGKVIVTLPDPRIILTDTKIDQEGIREYVSFARSHFSDRELAEYERQGRNAIVANIPNMGLVDGARESAARQIIPIIVRMGYSERDIVVEFRQDFDKNDIRRLLDLNNVEKR